MEHPIYRVKSVKVVGPYSLYVEFDDDFSRTIELETILEGELYGPLRDPTLFRKVSIDPEVHTLVWPNGADFDPAILHDWPDYFEAMKSLAQGWAMAKAS
ncbi:MAG: DUF2442 domain-containing protein [bacterium]|nr:DUF2442 domain-containing protein [bacterium]